VCDAQTRKAYIRDADLPRKRSFIIAMKIQPRRRDQVRKSLLGICFWREAPEKAVGPDRRAGKRGVDRSRKAASRMGRPPCECLSLKRFRVASP
jgi:hypothetical protein